MSEEIGINEAMSICLLHEVKVYPVYIDGKFYIEVKEASKQPTRYKKSFTDAKTDYKPIAEAIAKTYIFIAKKIIKEST